MKHDERRIQRQGTIDSLVQMMREAQASAPAFDERALRQRNAPAQRRQRIRPASVQRRTSVGVWPGGCA